MNVGDVYYRAAGCKPSGILVIIERISSNAVYFRKTFENGHDTLSHTISVFERRFKKVEE